MKVATLMLLLTMISCIVYANTPVEVVRHIPKPIRDTLNMRFPGWRFHKPDPGVIDSFRRFHAIPARNLSLLKADFDGNGQPDYAVLIVTRPSQRRLLVFLRRGQDYRQRTLDVGRPLGFEYLALGKQGTSDHNFTDNKDIIYAYDTIQLNYFEKAGESFLYEHGRFRRIVSSD